MKKLASWIAESRLTDAEVAAAVGISQPSIWRIKNGVHKASPETAAALEQLTGIPAWEFIKPTPEQLAS